MSVAVTMTEQHLGRRVIVPLALIGAAFIGFVISLYLTLMHYRGFITPCHVVQGCETVQTSRFAVILGVPLALLGTLFFTLMFYLGIGVLTRPRRRVVLATKVLAYAGALAVIPLFLIQAVILKAFCSYCLATEFLMLFMWGISFAVSTPESAETGVRMARRKDERRLKRTESVRTRPRKRSRGRA